MTSNRRVETLIFRVTSIDVVCLDIMLTNDINEQPNGLDYVTIAR